MPKLTKTCVDELKPREEGDYFVWDDTQPGFGVRVWPGGRKVYVIQYRVDGRTKRMTVGNHGVFTTEEARKRARVLQGDVARGNDPQEELRTRRTAISVAELTRRYLEAADKGLIEGKGGRPKKASTLATDRGRIERHINPLLGKMRVIDVKRADIAKFVRDVSAGKTAVTEKTAKKRGKAVVKGGLGTAARTTGLLGGIFAYAVDQGIIESNPVTGVKRPRGNRRKVRFTGADYQRLGKALDLAGCEGVTWQAVAAVRLIALTGCRKGEILALKWAEVDDSAKCLFLEDTKEGPSVRPLGQPALDLLKSIPRGSGSPYVLPAIRGEGHFGGLSRAWKRIVEWAELDGLTLHSLRHSFASEAADDGYGLPMIAAMLGHSNASIADLAASLNDPDAGKSSAGRTTMNYIHQARLNLLEATDAVGRKIDALMKARP